MTTFYCIAPATLEDILADVYVDLRELLVPPVAAADVVDRVYDDLVPDDGPVVYHERLVDGLFHRLSDWIRDRVRNGDVLTRVRDVLLERLTDEFYLETHA